MIRFGDGLQIAFNPSENMSLDFGIKTGAKKVDSLMVAEKDDQSNLYRDDNRLNYMDQFKYIFLCTAMNNVS